MGNRSTPKRVMIIAGEASGDQHGAMLVRSMLQRDNSLLFCGIGGQALKNAGVEVVIEAATLGVVGITEVFSKIPKLLKALALTRQMLRRLKPDLLILIDFPDFNLRVAPRAKQLGIPVLYYISPQIWAWRPGRVKKIGRIIDHMAVILPFEAAFYRRHNIPVTFVGHPLIDTMPKPVDVKRPQKESANVSIGLLPGSRDREVVRHLPVMLAAAGLVKERIGKLKVIVSLAPSVNKDLKERLIRSHRPGGMDVELAKGPVREVFEKSRLVVAASGTVTLEAAIAGVPMVIIYKVSPLSAKLGKALIRVRHVGLANLIAGREVVPELLQNDATPEKIAKKVYQMLLDETALENMRGQMLTVREQLGEPGASHRLADIAFEMMQQKP